MEPRSHYHEERRKRTEKVKARNRQRLDALEAAGIISVRETAKPTHVVLYPKAGNDAFDFWPSTGRWVRRRGLNKPRGDSLADLMKHVGLAEEATPILMAN